MLLLLSVFLPAAFSSLFLFSKKKYWHYFIATLASVSAFILVALVAGISFPGLYFARFDYNFTLAEITNNLQISFGVSHYLQLIFALLATFLNIPASIYAVSYMHYSKAHPAGSELVKAQDDRKFFCYFQLAICTTVAIAFSRNLLTLFIFYEMLTLLTYPLVIYNKTPEALKAGKIYLGFLMLPSLLLFLPAIIITFNILGHLEFVYNYDYSSVAAEQTAQWFSEGLLEKSGNFSLKLGLLLMFIYGVAKAAIMPLHFWLPKAMVAPTPVSALLHAVAVVKAGAFTLIMILIFVFGLNHLRSNNQEAALISEILIYITGFTVLLASLVALTKKNLKAILAYSTVSQLSYIIMTAALLTTGAIKAAAFYIVLHAFAKITLFFTVGAIYITTGKSSTEEINGIGRSMPITFTAFTIGALAMIGLPPTAGFLAKLGVLSSAMEAKNYFMLFVLIISTVLTSLYFLPIIFKGFFLQSNFKVKEAPFLMMFPYIITAAGVIILSLVPRLIPGWASFLLMR